LRFQVLVEFDFPCHYHLPILNLFQEELNIRIVFDELPSFVKLWGSVGDIQQFRYLNLVFYGGAGQEEKHS
jgi:hypothetical protein